MTKGSGGLPPAGTIRCAAQPHPDWPEVKVGDGPVHVISATADQMFLDITPHQAAGLPRYTGEMELTNHSAGSLTSQAYQKRWIRKTELLADAAEKSSVAAEWLGARPYPLERLNDAWTLAMGAHFHDLAAGTATPRSYEFAWNDDVIAMNQFADVLTNATEGVASELNTSTSGVPLVVFNPLNIEREDVVEAEDQFWRGCVEVRARYSPGRQEVPAQISGGKVIFLAKLPSVGYGVYDVRPGGEADNAASTLHVSNSELENKYYRVQLEPGGRCRKHLRQDHRQGVTRGSGASRHLRRQSGAMAGMEHGLGPGAGRAEVLCRRTSADARRRKRSRPCSHRGVEGNRRIPISCRPSAFLPGMRASGSSSSTRSTGTRANPI